MKKAILVCITVLAVCLTACDKFGTKVFVSNYSEGIALNSNEKTIDLVNHFKKRAGAPETMTVTVEGETVTGNYTESSNSAFYNCDYDEYSFKSEDGTLYVFGINQSTGNLVRFGKYNGDSHTYGSELSRDECYEKALTYLKKYVGENYEFAEETSRELGTMNPVRTFTFARKINGIKTAAKADIHVYSDGELLGFWACLVPSMDGIEEISVDSEKNERLISEKILEIDKNADYKIKDSTLYRLKDGRFGTDYEISVGNHEGLWLFVFN